MYNDEHLEAKRMELFVFLTPSSECAAESPVTDQGLLKWRLEIQNILTSYLSCWPWAGIQIMAWTKSTNGYLGLFGSHCALHSELIPLLLYRYIYLPLITTFFGKWLTASIEKGKTAITRRWFVSVNSDILWPLGALRASWLFDVPHAFCLPWWVGKTKPERAQGRFGATTLRRC